MEAYEIEPDAEGTNPQADNFDSFNQWQLPNGNFITIGPHTSQDTTGIVRGPPTGERTGPNVSFNDRLADDRDIADSISQAEAALAYHSFGEHTLEFSEVFEHPSLNVRTNGHHTVDGLGVIADDASYRATTSTEWQDKFSFDVPSEYEGRLLISFEYRGADDSRCFVRVLRDGEEVYETRTGGAEWIESDFVTSNVPFEETPTFNIQIRALPSENAGPNGADSVGEVRFRNFTALPEFEYEGERYWTEDITREPLESKELNRRV